MKIHSYLLFGLVIMTANLAVEGGTVSGNLQGPSGLPVNGGVLSFRLEQAGLIAGSASVAPLSASCYTSENGSVVGLPDPQQIPMASVNPGSGGLPGGIYYVETTFYAGSQETLPSPELRVQLSGAGTLTIFPPSSFPRNATGMRVYIGMLPGGEEFQGQTTGQAATYSLAADLTAGAAPPTTNNSACTIAFNDTIIPYSGYHVTLISPSGNAYPGWPQEWQLNGGFSETVDISSGAPLWNGTIIYPQPIFAQPLNHGLQSISGPLGLSGYDIFGIGHLGVGTNTPGWGIDVEGSGINSQSGYLFNGSAPANHVLIGNGSYYVDSATLPASILTGLALHYQTAQSNGTTLAQEPAVNFSSRFALNDNTAIATNVDLASSGVSVRVYTNPSLTVDTYGRVTGASNGPAARSSEELLITSGICTTSGAEYSSGACTFSVSWPTPFVDTNYTVVCSPFAATLGKVVWAFPSAKTATGFTIMLENGSASGAVPSTTNEIDCHGSHL